MALVLLQPFLWRQVRQHVVDFNGQRSHQHQLAEILARNSELQQQEVSQAATLQKVDGIIPSIKSIPQLVGDLEREAAEQQLPIEIVSITKDIIVATPLISAELHPTAVAIRLVGNSGALLRYFEAVEHRRELVLVQEWSLEPESGGALPAVSANYVLTMNILFFLDDDTL